MDVTHEFFSNFVGFCNLTPGCRPTLAGGRGWFVVLFQRGGVSWYREIDFASQGLARYVANGCGGVERSTAGFVAPGNPVVSLASFRL